MNIDEEALLAAIEATPLDDAPRLIYADWLQERDEDAKAEYLRSVVALMNTMKNIAALVRCIELSKTIDTSWRQRVGARFEIVIEGFSAAEVMARFIFAAFRVNWPIDESSTSPEPFRLVCNLTPEEAERMRGEFEPFANAIQDSKKHRINLIVQPMQEESSLGLLG